MSLGRGTGETQNPEEFCTFECICVAIMNFRVFVVVIVQKKFSTSAGLWWYTSLNLRTNSTSLVFVILPPLQINKPDWERFPHDKDVKNANSET